MSRSVVYRERETDTREWDEQPRRTYTTVKRYQVPESSAARSSLGLGQEETKEKVVIRREKSAQPLRNEDDYRVSERYSDRKPRDDIDIKITERTREREQPRQQEDDYRFTERIIEREREPRRDVTYRVIERERESDYDDRRSSARSDYRTDYRSDYRVEQERQSVRAPSPPTQDRVREFRFEREREFDPPQRYDRREDSYEVERYSKDTEYYAPAPAPQPIIIRERAAPAPQPIIIREERREPAPIIIREERREPQYEFIERREVEEEKSLVKREEPPPPAPQPQPQPQEEDYFYERRVREINREPRRRSDSYDRRTEIRPRDSASNYSSDDSYEKVRIEKTYGDDRDSHHKLHLAEGALAGAVGAQILRKHRESEGKNAGGRVKTALEGAVVGAIGTEAVSRFRSRSRRRESRSRSSSVESRRTRRSRRKARDRSRSRSRSKSISKKQLAGLAGVAAVGALAGYALNKKNKQETIIVNDRSPPRRSRSRRRRGSPDSYMDEQLRDDDKYRDPDHRNRRIAQAGLASAAAAGIWERVRSKSRGGKDRERSKSRIRTGVPIAAAGLGGAALAGLYEKNKASKEAKKDAIIAEESGRGRRRSSHSRNRSRSVPARYPDDSRSVDHRGMIAYGDEPIRPGGERGYYSDEEPAVYRRRGGSSDGSSPDNRRRSKSRGRGREYAEAGAAGGVAAVAAHEYGKRSERKKDERQRREEEAWNNHYNEGYGPPPGNYNEPPSGYLDEQQQHAPYQQGAYPSSTYFPPPPTAPVENPYVAPAPGYHNEQTVYPPYNPADYPPGPSPANPEQHQYPYDASRGAYGDTEANLGAPYGGETYAGDNRYNAPGPEVPHDEHQRGRDPNNVSLNEQDRDQDADGVRTPRARSNSRVRFDLGANEAHSPEAPRKSAPERFSDSETSGDKKRRHRHSKRSSRHERDRSRDRERSRDRGALDSHDRDSPQLMNDKYDRPPRKSRRRDDDEESEGTVDLPPRFDEDGNRKPEANDALQQILGSLASKFLGGDEEERGGRSSRRRH